jgi:hypothetical protein
MGMECGFFQENRAQERTAPPFDAASGDDLAKNINREYR